MCRNIECIVPKKKNKVFFSGTVFVMLFKIVVKVIFPLEWKSVNTLFVIVIAKCILND